MTSRPDRIRNATDLLCLVFFSVGIGLPLLGLVLGWQPDAGLRAATRAATAALPEPLPLRSFPERFESYFDSQLGFRDLMVRWNNAVTVLWFATAPRTRVQHNTAAADLPETPAPHPGRLVLGSDQWLFYLPPFADESRRGIDPMDARELEAWKRYFEARRRQLSARGIDYLLVVPPEKQSVYPSRLPWSMRVTAGRTRGDQLLEHLSRTSSVDLLDLRTSLRAVLQDERIEHSLYHRTGTHWNELGAYFAYREILLHLQPRFPALAPLPLTSFDVRERTGATRGLARMLGIGGLLTEEYVDLTPHRPRVARPVDPPSRQPPAKRLDENENWSGQAVSRATDREELPRAVFVHDSFVAAYLEPFLSEHFEWVEYRWTNRLNARSLAESDLDLVIEVRSERLFDTHLPRPGGGLTKRESRQATGPPGP